MNIQGTKGNDYLTGTAESDVLKGGKGNDVLDGRDGADILKGGKGADTFIFTDFGFNYVDTIKDFQPGIDKIVVETDGQTLGYSGSGLVYKQGDFTEFVVSLDGNPALLVGDLIAI